MTAKTHKDGSLIIGAPPGPLDEIVVNVSTMVSKVLPPQEFIIDPWLPVGGNALIVAHRGTAKTWVSMSVARAVSRGEDFMGFHVPAPRRLLAVDGEMPEVPYQARWKDFMGGNTNKLLSIIHREALRDGHQPAIKIDTTFGQDRIWTLLKTLRERGQAPELIILDAYGSFLSGGTSTYSNDEARDVTSFLVNLSIEGYAVLLTHHTGHDKTRLRGASGLEDHMDTVIVLEKIEDPNVRGANIKMKFTKTRQIRPDRTDNTIYTLQEQDDGVLDWTMNVEPKSSVEPVLRAVHEGVSNWQGLMDVLGCSKATAHRRIKTARKKGLLMPDGELRLTAEGEAFLGLGQQEDIPF